MSENHYSINYRSIEDCAERRKCTVGIGRTLINGLTYPAVNESTLLGEHVLVPYTREDELVNALYSGDIDCAVRGSFSAGRILSILKNRSGQKALMRIALMRASGGQYFFLAPVGIDEGQDNEEKLKIIENAVKLIRALGFEPRIGVLSSGRKEDLGRNRVVDATIRNAKSLNDKLKTMGYDSTDFGILIEDAILNTNLIIAPDGIIGNYIFRTLYHLGNGDSIGAPVVNIDRTFVDTSRTKKNYSSAVILAAALHNVAGF